MGEESPDLTSITQLDKLTELVLRPGGGVLWKLENVVHFLNTSKSSESMIKFYIYQEYHYENDDEFLSIVNAVSRFINLEKLAIYIPEDPTNNLWAVSLLKKLRVLIIYVPGSLSSDNLIELVRYLPHLEELCLSPTNDKELERLQKSAQSRISEICRKRRGNFQHRVLGVG